MITISIGVDSVQIVPDGGQSLSYDVANIARKGFQIDSLRIRFLKRVPELPSKSTGTDRSMQVSKRCPVVMAFSSLFGSVLCCGN